MTKKKILIAGAAGMVGHMLYNFLRSTEKYEIGATTRKPVDFLESLAIDIEEDLSAFGEIVKVAEPDVIINCIGLLVKASESCPAEAIYVNSFFPHLLENITGGTKTKIIHLSTDCVFDGNQEVDLAYYESDRLTEKNWYGRTKAMGEINNDKDLTLRMSIIGPEKKDGVGLFHWFISQKGKVNGYVNHHWNGLTTLELAKQIDKIIDTNLSGIYHLACPYRITKYDLLNQIKKSFSRDIEIEKFESAVVNKVLANNRLDEYNPHIPSYETQIDELREFISKK
jgi:dTDP-4-dehydrorhamnose reductase